MRVCVCVCVCVCTRIVLGKGKVERTLRAMARKVSILPKYLSGVTSSLLLNYPNAPCT